MPLVSNIMPKILVHIRPNMMPLPGLREKHVRVSVYPPAITGDQDSIFRFWVPAGIPAEEYISSNFRFQLGRQDQIFRPNRHQAGRGRRSDWSTVRPKPGVQGNRRHPSSGTDDPVARSWHPYPHGC